MTAYNASKMLAGVQPRSLPTGAGVTVISTIALTAALVANDTINMMQIGADAAEGAPNYGPVISTVVLDCDQLDSSTGLTLDVGDSAAAQRYMAAVTTGQGGGYTGPNKSAVLGYAPFASTFNTYPTASLANYTIFVTCHHAATTWVNGTLRLKVEYTYDP